MAKRSRIDAKSLLDYARTGAQARLAEIQRELAAMMKVFPELSKRTAAGGIPSTAIPPPRATPRRKRRKLTAAERKAIGLRMKKYWAGRRKAKAGK
jgi:hypothetical protein